MEMSDSIKELAGALAKAQGEMKAAEMSATNPFLKNKYADLGENIKASKPALTKNGLAIVQPVTCTGDFVTVTTMLLHESGEWIRETFSLPLGEAKGKSLAQEAGSLITYLRRYSLAAMIGLYSDEDTDGNGKADNGKQQGNGNGHRAPVSSQPPDDVPVDDRTPAVIPPEEVTTDKGTVLGNLNTDQLKQFRSMVETSQNEKKKVSPQNLIAYEAAGKLINIREHQPA